jgi:NAD(P)-dependent dehydrogenase (short-subunit alcohol dehydrogenase family)
MARELALAGKSAVVTAGGGAIGSATAGVLVRDGAHVVIAGRTEEKLQRVVERLSPLAEESGGSIDYRVANGLDEGQIRALVDAGAERTGRLDIAVNVVGGGGGSTSPVLRYSVEMLEGTFRQNITSAYLLLKHACGHMVRSGQGGSFVAVSSMQATEPAPFLSAYCAAKAGLEMLCKTAADELGEHNVRINLVRPGLTRTGAPGHPSSDQAAQEAYYVEQPLRRPGDPQNIAEAIRYFAGPESEWTTGTTLTVDGGASLRRFPDLAFYWKDRIGEEMDKAAKGIVD